MVHFKKKKKTILLQYRVHYRLRKYKLWIDKINYTSNGCR